VIYFVAALLVAYIILSEIRFRNISNAFSRVETTTDRQERRIDAARNDLTAVEHRIAAVSFPTPTNDQLQYSWYREEVLTKKSLNELLKFLGIERVPAEVKAEHFQYVAAKPALIDLMTPIVVPIAKADKPFKPATPLRKK
jgi:citrate synthase